MVLLEFYNSAWAAGCRRLLSPPAMRFPKALDSKYGNVITTGPHQQRSEWMKLPIPRVSLAIAEAHQQRHRRLQNEWQRPGSERRANRSLKNSRVNKYGSPGPHQPSSCPLRPGQEKRQRERHQDRAAREGQLHLLTPIGSRRHHPWVTVARRPALGIWQNLQ